MEKKEFMERFKKMNSLQRMTLLVESMKPIKEFVENGNNNTSYS